MFKLSDANGLYLVDLFLADEFGVARPPYSIAKFLLYEEPMVGLLLDYRLSRASGNYYTVVKIEPLPPIQYEVGFVNTRGLLWDQKYLPVYATVDHYKVYIHAKSPKY